MYTPLRSLSQHTLVCLFLVCLLFATISCNRCDPPPCERTQKVVEWTSFFKYNKTTRFVNGAQIDTMDISYAEVLNFCGVEECLTELAFIQIEAVSRKNNFSFLIKDQANDLLYLSKVSGVAGMRAAVILKPTTKIVAYEALRGSYLLKSITINNQVTDAIVMNFSTTDDIQSITIAKDYGIIEYTDKQGNIWRKEA